jgi:hypothetical protein
MILFFLMFIKNGGRNYPSPFFGYGYLIVGNTPVGDVLNI